MSVTIKDVAREAGVSVATVSRALNGHSNVAEPVRKRVLGVAERLHYSPHHAARSLSSRRTHTIGVVLPELHGDFFSELMRGIDQAARARGLHLLVSTCHGDRAGQGAAVRAMRGRVDGLLLMPQCADGRDPDDDDIEPAMPALLINGQPGVHAALNVDGYGGARAMVRHLVGAGHRRIAFIAGPEGNFDARERLRGYRGALSELVSGAAPRVLDGDFSGAAGYRAGRALLADGRRPDAVFAANDMMALGCLFAFNQAGVRVPDEVALAGFDDIPLARYVHPALTTMRVDAAALGERALGLLLQGGLAQDAAIAVPPVLVVRESSRGR